MPKVKPIIPIYPKPKHPKPPKPPPRHTTPPPPPTLSPPPTHPLATPPAEKPKGRPKAPADVRLIARLLVPDAYRALKAALKRPGERVSAAQTILAYGVGKPQTNATVRVIHSIEDLSEAELMVIAGQTVDQMAIDYESDDHGNDEPQAIEDE